MANRLVELALEALESRKTQIEAEIKGLRSQIRRGINALSARTGARRRKGRSRRGRKRVRTAASRKAQSLRMKEYWAKRRAESHSGGGKRR